MKEEIQEILDDLQNEDCYWLDCGRKNTSLTDEEAHLLLNYISNLQSQLKAKEEVIKEAREYANKEIRFVNMQEYENLLEILSKGENK